MILLDTNVFMYAAGADHPNKAPAGRFLDRVALAEIEAAIDAETLQEILHRYRAIRRWDDGRRVFDLARTVVPVVLPVTVGVLDRARGLLDRHTELMARDSVHAAVALQPKSFGVTSEAPASLTRSTRFSARSCTRCGQPPVSACTRSMPSSPQKPGSNEGLEPGSRNSDE